MLDGDLVHLNRAEPDPGHASQLAGDGARDVAGSEIGGRAPAFTLTQIYPDEGHEGGDLKPRGAAGGKNGKPMIIYKTLNTPNNNMYSPTYASPPNNTFPLPLLDSRAPNPPYTGPQTGLGGVPRVYTR